MDHDSMAQSPAPRPLCGCEKQRTDRGSRLGGALLGLYGRAIFSAAEIRFRVRQRRELGIERFRRVGLCTEESDAATLPPIHCPLCTEHEHALDALSLMDEEGPLPHIHCPRCAQYEQALAALSLMDEEGPLPHIPYHRCTPGEHALAVLSVMNKEEPLPPNHTS